MAKNGTMAPDITPMTQEPSLPHRGPTEVQSHVPFVGPHQILLAEGISLDNAAYKGLELRHVLEVLGPPMELHEVVTLDESPGSLDVVEGT